MSLTVKDHSKNETSFADISVGAKTAKNFLKNNEKIMPLSSRGGFNETKISFNTNVEMGNMTSPYVTKQQMKTQMEMKKGHDTNA